MKRSNSKILLVGGAVRDLLTGKKASDYDFLVADGSISNFKLRFPESISAGKSHTVFIVDGYEYSFPRNGGNSPDERIDNDLIERDFTINALALDEDGELYTHPDSLFDIYNKMLRPTSSHALIADPLRIFRAAGLYARFPELNPSSELMMGMKKCSEHNLLSNLAPDRIAMEVRKALSGKSPGNFIRLLHKTNCLDPWFKCFATRTDSCPHNILNTRIDSSAKLMDKMNFNSIFCWGALCHSLGRSFSNNLKALNKINSIGQQQAFYLGKKLKLPNKYIKAGEISAGYFKLACNYKKLTVDTKVDLLLKLHSTNLLDMMKSLTAAEESVGLMESAQKELDTILKVRLKPNDQNRGRDSGRILREMRIETLKKI
ncbi:CCA tRNA nucleotidyltransferase [Maridesulfovibrio bastinii]|uniref:CCA tRNA nucleotidyltransferase n=1 Tax=Maridesulfovibrio bastinii TaxID=47157 RepID=UPI0003F9264E|nr:CCA tRNA nucleotidyltransferase [Maridesulfovibrio bastinii]